MKSCFYKTHHWTKNDKFYQHISSNPLFRTDAAEVTDILRASLHMEKLFCGWQEGHKSYVICSDLSPSYREDETTCAVKHNSSISSRKAKSAPSH